MVAGGPGSAFGFMGADPNAASGPMKGIPGSAIPFDPSTAFKVDDAQDGSGSYAAQYAVQLANDPGYAAEEGSAEASGFNFLNKSGSLPIVGGSAAEARHHGDGTISGSDPGTPGGSGFSFLKPVDGALIPGAQAERGANPGGEAGDSAGGQGFSFVNSTAAADYTPEPEEDLGAKVAEEAGHRRQVLQQLLVQVKNHGEALGVLTGTVRGMLWDIQSSHKEAVRQIQQATQQTILGLQQREQDLLLQTNKAHAEKVMQLTNQAESLEAPLMQMRSGVGMWENAVCNSTHQDLLNMADEMQIQLEEMIKFEWDPNPKCDSILRFIPCPKGSLEVGQVETEEKKEPEPPPPPPAVIQETFVQQEADALGDSPPPLMAEPAASIKETVGGREEGELASDETETAPPVGALQRGESAFNLGGIGGGAFNLGGITGGADDRVPEAEPEADIDDLLSGGSVCAVGGSDSLLVMQPRGMEGGGLDLRAGGEGGGAMAVPPVAGAPASTDELMDLFDDIPQRHPTEIPKKGTAKAEKKEKEKKTKEKKSKDKKGRKSPPPGEPPAMMPAPPVGGGGGLGGHHFLRSTLSLKNPSAQFEHVWTSAQLSHKASGKLRSKMTEDGVNSLMSQNRLVTIAGGAVNGIVKGYYMGEIERLPGTGVNPAMVMLEVVMDPGALRLEATLKVSEPTTLPAFKEFMGGILEPLLT